MPSEGAAVVPSPGIKNGCNKVSVQTTVLSDTVPPVVVGQIGAVVPLVPATVQT